MRNRIRLPLLLLGVLVFKSATSSPAEATLKFYYDPDTGNVSFDTAETRNGSIVNYFFNVGRQSVPWQFRSENLVRLSNSALFTAVADLIGETTLTTPWNGLYTIGDVFPIGLSEDVWQSFVQSSYHVAPMTYGYNDLIGAGAPPPAQFIYGPPNGEFKNRWDLVDPDTLTWASSAKLIYHEWSGEVFIDTTGDMGGYIAGFRLISNGEIRADQFVPPVDSVLTGVHEGTAYLFADAIEPGRYSVGRILSPGLFPDQFESALASARFLGRPGFNGGSFDFETDGIAMALQWVPEPNSLALISVAFVAACGLRRRRAR